MNKKLLNKVMKKLASSNVVISPTVKSSSTSLSMQKKPETEQVQQKLEQSGFASPLLAAHQHGGHSVGAPVHASAPLGSYAQHPAVETVHPEIFRRYALCQRSHSVLAVPFGKGVHIGK